MTNALVCRSCGNTGWNNLAINPLDGTRGFYCGCPSGQTAKDASKTSKTEVDPKIQERLNQWERDTTLDPNATTFRYLCITCGAPMLTPDVYCADCDGTERRAKAGAISYLAGIDLYRSWRGVMGRRSEYIGRAPDGLIRLIDQFCDAFERTDLSELDAHKLKQLVNVEVK